MMASFQVVAPKGYFQMRAGLRYVLLRSCSRRRRVLLVTFIDAKRPGKRGRVRKAELVILDRDLYEQGLVPPPGKEPAIEVVRQPWTLPPWLHDLEGRHFEGEERWRLPRDRTGVSPYDEAADRLQRITAAIKKVDSILLADDPDAELRKMANECVPAVNGVRFVTWFYAYIAFGHSVWALLSPRTEWGRWDRQDPKRTGSRFGRRAEHRDRELFAARIDAEMVDRMVEGFRVHGRGEQTVAGMWSAVVRLTFGAEIIKKPGERYVVLHPEGKPVPSYDQFYYHLRKRLGSDIFRKAMWGTQRVDEREAPIKGSNTADLANVGERAHFDATSIPERPKSYIGEYHLAPLYAVDLVDGMTSRVSGIGFSLGSETGRAYRYALFCAAIKKSKFGEIVGVPITDDEWPDEGLPSSVFGDRGPGMSTSVREAIKGWIEGVEMSRSYHPRDNANVETAHGKRKKKVGAPEVALSNLTVIKLMRSQIRRVITKNHSGDVLGRVPERALVEEGAATPEQLHRWLVKRHRNNLVPIPFDEAVRCLLDEITLVGKKGKLYWLEREYTSPEVYSSGLGNHIRSQEGVRLKGYAFQLIGRYAWVEFNGKLVEVKAHGLDVEDRASIPEMEAIAAHRRKASGKRQAVQKLEVLYGDQQDNKALGKEPAVRYRRGKPKLTADAIDEMSRLNAME